LAEYQPLLEGPVLKGNNMEGQKQSCLEQGLLFAACLACDYHDSILHWGEISKRYLNTKNSFGIRNTVI